MKKMLLGFVLMCGMSAVAFAQENELSDASNPAAKPPRLYIGLTGGYERIFHSEGISNPLSNQNFDPALSNGFFVGLNTEYILGDPKDWYSSIVLKTYYSNLTTARATLSGEEVQIVDANGQSATTSQTQFGANFSTSFINTELLYVKYFYPFSISGGFGIAFPLSGKMEKRFEILKPDSASFAGYTEKSFQYEENGRVMILEDDDISKVNYYAKLGIGYDIFLKRMFYLTPSIYYNFGLNRATNTENFNINSLQFGLDLKAAL